MRSRFPSRGLLLSPGLGIGLVLVLLALASDGWAESEVAVPGACCLEDLTCRIFSPEACDLLGGYFLGEGSNCDSNPCNDPPACSVSPATIDFGPVGVSQFRDKNFRITNTGGRFLEGAISEACIEYAIVGDRFYEIGPGQSKIFTIRYTPQKEGPSSCGFFLDGGCPELIAVGTGESAPRCEVSPITLDFGPVTIDEGRDLPFTVTNRGGGFLTGSVTVPCTDFFLAGTGGYNLAGGESKEFVLRFLPVEVGERSCLVEIDGCDPLLATALGELAPECIFEPNPVFFDTTFIGESSVQAFRLTNGGGGILEGELDLACADFRLIGDTTYRLAPGGTAFYSLVFEPERLGGQLCEVQAEDPCDLLAAVGHGAAGPQCVLSQKEIDYGIVHLGDSSVRELIITNEGESLLEGALQFDCEAFSILGPSEYRLASGESATFRVEFTPRDLGEERCTALLGERCADVLLLGRGEDPPVCSVSPGLISFGATPLQNVVRDSVVVTNLGVGILTGEAVLACSDPGITLIGETSFALAAGEQLTLRIEYAPTELGEVDCLLQISDRCGAVPILAEGIELPECEIVPSFLSLGGVPIGVSVDTSVVVTNVGSGVLTGQPHLACQGFTLQGPAEFALAAGESEVYELSFAPTEEGRIDCEVPFGATCGIWAVDGEGLGPICAVEPSSLDFGVVIPGEVGAQAVVVSNLGGGDLVGTLSWDCPLYSIDGQSSGTFVSYHLQAGESDTFLVQFAPLGPSIDNCTVSVGAEGMDCRDLELLGSGGDPPQCDLTPARMDMVVELGVTTASSAVVTNRGQGRLIGTLASNCESLEVLSPADFALAENESARIEISVTATALESYECEIDLGPECEPLLVQISVVPRRGACCLLDGSCRILSEAGCETIQGTLWDPESRCQNDLCQPQGACCLIDGGCRVGPRDDCPPEAGTYLGDGLSCDPDPCPTAGACCLQSGDCVVTTSDRCDDQAGFWSVTMDCGLTECALLGACCLLDEMCIFVPQPECEDGEGFFLGAGATCLPEPCEPVGACCFAEGDCRLVPQAVCQADLGVLWTEGVSCDEVLCNPRGACCLDDGSCILSTEADCPGRYLGEGTICSVQACRRIGACCDSQEVCTITWESTCEGTFFGARQDCDPSPCRSRVQSVQVIRSDNGTLFSVDTDDPRIEDLQGWYRRGGEFAFSEIQDFTQEGRQWSSALASDDYTIRGVEYYLQYVDVQLGLTVLHGSADQPRRLILRDKVSAPSTLAKRFLLLSPPAEIDAPSLGVWLRSQFGRAGRTSWRLGWWDPSVERYLEQADDFLLPDAVGRGYWLALAEDTSWAFPATTRYPVGTLNSYRIALSPGWNMIGNPAAYPIGVGPRDVWIEDGDLLLSLADARPHRVGEILVLDSDPSAAGPLFPYRAERTSLEMWEGGWIENRTDHELALLLPAGEAIPLLGRDPDGGWSSDPDSDWSGDMGGDSGHDSDGDSARDSTPRALELLVATATESARVDLILHPDATAGLDSWDIGVPPPAPDRSLEVFWSTAERRLLRHATAVLERPFPTLRIASETPISLSWTVGDDIAFELIHLQEEGPSIDLQAVQSIQLPGGGHEFRLVARSETEPSPALPSGRISIEPNPVRRTTTVLLELEKPGAVRIDLFGPAGKRVWSEDRGLLSAGRHLFVWDGRDNGGNPVPAGTYFVSAQVGGNRYTRKLVLVR